MSVCTRVNQAVLAWFRKEDVMVVAIVAATVFAVVGFLLLRSVP